MPQPVIVAPPAPIIIEAPVEIKPKEVEKVVPIVA
jgi:hypothetical protein